MPDTKPKKDEDEKSTSWGGKTVEIVDTGIGLAVATAESVGESVSKTNKVVSTATSFAKGVVEDPSKDWGEKIVCGVTKTFVSQAAVSRIYMKAGVIGAQIGAGTGAAGGAAVGALGGAGIGAVPGAAVGTGVGATVGAVGAMIAVEPIASAAAKPIEDWTEKTCHATYKEAKEFLSTSYEKVKDWFPKETTPFGFGALLTPIGSRAIITPPITATLNTKPSEVLAKEKPAGKTASPSSPKLEQSKELRKTTEIPQKAQAPKKSKFNSKPPSSKPSLEVGTSQQIKGLKSNLGYERSDSETVTPIFETESAIHLSTNELNRYLSRALSIKELQLEEAQWDHLKAALKLTDNQLLERLDPLIEFHQLLSKKELKKEHYHKEIYTNLKLGLELVQQISILADDQDLGKFASASLHLIQGGAAVLAMAGVEGAAAALGMAAAGPLGWGVLAFTALNGVISILGDDEGDGLGEALQQIHQEVINTQKMIFEFRHEVYQRLELMYGLQKDTYLLTREIYDSLLDNFNYLHHTLTIPVFKHFNALEQKIDSKFSILDAKIGLISLQPLNEVIFKTNPYLNGLMPLEHMQVGQFSDYIGPLGGYLSKTVKDETFTHSVILTTSSPLEHPQLVFDNLKKISTDAVTLPNYIGLIVGYMQEIGVDASLKQPANALFNVLIGHKALKTYLELRKTFSHFPYDQKQVELKEIAAQFLTLQSYFKELKNEKVIEKFFHEYEQGKNGVQQSIQQTITNDPDAIYAQSVEHRLAQMPIAPKNPNFQDLKISRTFSMNHPFSIGLNTSFLFEDILGYTPAGERLPPFSSIPSNFWHMTDKMGKLFSYAYPAKVSFSSKNPLLLSGKDQELFAFLNTIGITIPKEFILAELLGFGYFKTFFRSCLLHYTRHVPEDLDQVLSKDRSPADFNYSLAVFDTEGSCHFGLDLNFHAQDNVLVKVFLPKSGYLYERNIYPRASSSITKYLRDRIRSGNKSSNFNLERLLHRRVLSNHGLSPEDVNIQKLKSIFYPESNVIPHFIGSTINHYDKNQMLGHPEWEIFKMHAKEVALIPPTRNSDVELIRQKINAYYLDKRSKLSHSIISRIEHSPEVHRLYAVKQLIIAYATLFGLPQALIQDLYNTFNPNDELDYFKQYQHKQASLDIPFTSKFPSEEKLQQLKNAFIQSIQSSKEGQLSLIEHSLATAIVAIRKYQLELEEQKLSQGKTRLEILQGKVLEHQQVLRSLLMDFHNLLETLSEVQNELPPSPIVQELFNAYPGLQKQYELLLENFELDAVDETPALLINEEKEEFVSTLDAESLQSLCASPNAPLSKIQNFLNQLEKERRLDFALNAGEIETRPLHLAIAAERKDVVALLLEHGAVIEPQVTMALVQKHTGSEVRAHMTAILEFYQTMHTEVSGLNAFEIGRTLGLINENLSQLSHYENLESANLIFGNTGDGKSTLANVLAGVDYELVIEDGQASLRVKSNSLPEITATSASSSSETTYPQIIKLEEGYVLVDMPGVTDNRGLAFNIANGLSALMLTKVFKSLRSLIVVVDAANIYKARSQDISNAFDMLGKIIHNKQELIPHILLVVNKATSQHVKEGPAVIKRRLNKLLKENLHLEASTQFLLSQITEEQILVVNEPSKSLRTEILTRLEKFSAKPFKDFNFVGYHSEAAHFQNLLTHLQKYQSLSCDHLRDLIKSLGSDLAALIQKAQSLIGVIPSEASDFASAHVQELKNQYQHLEEILGTQEAFKDTLELNFNKAEQFVETELNKEARDEVVFESRHLIELKQRAYEVQLVRQFLDRLAPIATQLNIMKASECSFLPSDEQLSQDEEVVTMADGDNEMQEAIHVREYRVQNNAGLEYSAISDNNAAIKAAILQEADQLQTNSAASTSLPFSLFHLEKTSNTARLMPSLPLSTDSQVNSVDIYEHMDMPVVQCIKQKEDSISVNNSTVRVIDFDAEDTLHIVTSQSITASCKEGLTKLGVPYAIVEAEDSKVILENVRCEQLNVPTPVRVAAKTLITSAKSSVFNAGVPAAITGFAEGCGMSTIEAEKLGKETAFQLILASGSYAAIGSWYFTNAACKYLRVSPTTATALGTSVAMIAGTVEAVVSNNFSWSFAATQTVATTIGATAAAIASSYLGRKAGYVAGKLLNSGMSFWSKPKPANALTAALSSNNTEVTKLEYSR